MNRWLWLWISMLVWSLKHTVCAHDTATEHIVQHSGSTGQTKPMNINCAFTTPNLVPGAKVFYTNQDSQKTKLLSLVLGSSCFKNCSSAILWTRLKTSTLPLTFMKFSFCSLLLHIHNLLTLFTEILHVISKGFLNWFNIKISTTPKSI